MKWEIGEGRKQASRPASPALNAYAAVIRLRHLARIPCDSRATRWTFVSNTPGAIAFSETRVSATPSPQQRLGSVTIAGYLSRPRSTSIYSQELGSKTCLTMRTFED